MYRCASDEVSRFSEIALGVEQSGMFQLTHGFCVEHVNVQMRQPEAIARCHGYSFEPLRAQTCVLRQGVLRIHPELQCIPSHEPMGRVSAYPGVGQEGQGRRFSASDGV